MTWHDERPDETAYLAERLRLSKQEFEELFGKTWRADDTPPEHDYDADPSGGLGFPATPWHVAGEPPQLMIRVFDHGLFLATPRGRWSGHTLVYDPHDQQYVERESITDDAPAIVKRLLAARRRTFRYCRYCYGLTAPEDRFSIDTCNGCSSVVF